MQQMNKPKTTPIITNSIRKRINEITEADFSVSKDLMTKYMSQNRNGTKAPWLLKGLLECPACGRVVKMSNWANHKNFELNRRKGGRVTYIGRDGIYRCPIPGCDYPGTKKIAGWKVHLAKHPVDIL